MQRKAEMKPEDPKFVYSLIFLGVVGHNTGSGDMVAAFLRAPLWLAHKRSYDWLLLLFFLLYPEVFPVKE